MTKRSTKRNTWNTFSLGIESRFYSKIKWKPVLRIRNQKIIPLKESYFGIIDKTHWNEIRLRVSAWDESALTFWTLFILWLIVIKAKAYGTMGPSENRRFKAYHDRIYSEAPFTTFLQILGNLFTLFYSLFANQR